MYFKCKILHFRYLWLTGELFHDILDKMEDYTSFISDIFNEKAGELND